MGEARGGAPWHDRWYCGPPGDRRAYVVDDIRSMRGGQGHVLRAERRTFAGDPVGYEGPVSLKVSSEVLDPGQVARMRERWEALAGLDHPNLARPVELFLGPGLFRTEPPPGGDEDVLYISAAWVDGRGLRGAAPLAPGEAIALAGDLAAGVAELHAQGILHRDIHPGNVILGADGRAVLIDFGSSRPDDGTATATVAGALGFIAPEMLTGAGSTAADRWGLGMVTIFALLGHPRGTTTRPALEAELAAALDGVADRRGAVRLLMAMVDDDPDARPPDARRWARDLEACLTQRRGRPVAAVAGAAVAVVLAATAVGAWTLADDEEPRAEDAAPATPDPLPCTPATAAPPGAGASPALTAAVASLAPDACVGGTPELFVEARVQPLADEEGNPDGAVVLAPSGMAVRLNFAMWASYREMAGRATPTNAANYGGYPTQVTIGDEGTVTVTLDGGGMLVGRRTDTQIFWLPPQVLPLWNAHGGLDGDLGYPTTNPHFLGGRLELDFEGGYMEADAADFAALLVGAATVEDAVVVDDPDHPLEGVDVTEHIVRQRTGTAWWVDDEGVRHWIATGDDWNCLGGDDAVAASDVPGWAVATLPLGEVATCE